MSEQPFKVSVSDADLDLLRRKLDLVRLPDELEDVGWDYGTPLSDVKRLVARWKDGFDWRKAEEKINEFPQFTRDIEVDGFGTLNIHYLHQKSAVENAVPLLFVHGWPGHFLEAQKIIPLLTSASGEHPSFHVVALSLPGYGFSEAPTKKDFGLAQYAEVANKLMLALGYNEYVAQGGDWGHAISRTLAELYGHKYVKAWHTNFPFGTAPSLTKNPFRYLLYMVTPYSAEERAWLAQTVKFQQTGAGYNRLQSTRPQTLGYSLADSPVGLVAWIYEKLVTWTDGYPWTDDEVLTWISIYWFSRAGPAASVRIYMEVAKDRAKGTLGTRYSTIPLGLSYFPKELVRVPQAWARTLGNVVQESLHEHGGHFAAYERPEELSDDVRKMFAKGGPAHGVVPGKNGYA
ncbi:alpha/beta-hydrolase [Amylocystis lapponica]|nr:alpha/beta-hydrolase [Amylocystis lapponica]